MMGMRMVGWRLAIWMVVGVLPMAGAAAVLAADDPPQAPAEGPTDWSLDLDLTWNSKYVWRGIVVTPDPVLQPSVEFAWKGLTLSVWANMDTTDVNDYDWQSNEVDFTLDYTFSWKRLNVSVGAIHYVFPQAHAIDTTEVYAGIGLDVLTQPTLTVYQDLDEHDGQYLALGFGHTFENVWKPSADVAVSVDLGATLAWGSPKHNGFYYGAGAGWADATVSLGVPIAIGDKVTVTPSVNTMWVLDDDMASALGESHAFWAGISFTYSF